MPADPIMRARARQLLITMEREVFSYFEPLEKNLKAAEKARQIIRERLTEMVPIFAKQKHMLGEDFSMLDVAIAPLLWRLDHYGIELPKTAAPLMKYAERVFSRQGYIDALTDWKDPLFQKILEHLPPDAKMSEFIASVAVTGTKSRI